MQKTKGPYDFPIFCSSALKLRSSDERPRREREEIQPSPTPLPQAASLASRHNSYPSGTCTVFAVRYCLCRPILIKPILFSVCWWLQIVMSNVKRYCLVPGCRNTTFKTPQKRFISVPTNVPRRSSWLKAVRTKNQYSNKGSIFVCVKIISKKVKLRVLRKIVQIFDEICLCQGEVTVSFTYLSPI